MFADLIPGDGEQPSGMFDDLIPGAKAKPAPSSGMFDDLVPAAAEPGFVPTIKRTGGQMLTGVARAIDDITGPNVVTEKIRDTGQGIVDRNPAGITSLGDVVEKPWLTVKESVGQMVPQIAAGVPSRMAGAALGAKIGGQAAGGRGALIGGAIGGLAPIFVQEYGGIRDEQIEGGQESIPRALGGAVAATALERLGPEGRIIFKGLNPVARTGKEIAAQAGRDVLVEGATEGAQSVIEQVSAFKDPLDPASLEETALSSIMGGVGGGVVGGAHAALSSALAPADVSRGTSDTPPPAAPAAPVPPVEPVAPPGDSSSPSSQRSPGDPLRDQALPPAGPLSKAVNIGIEGEAQQADTGAPTPAPISGAMAGVPPAPVPAQGEGDDRGKAADVAPPAPVFVPPQTLPPASIDPDLALDRMRRTNAAYEEIVKERDQAQPPPPPPGPQVADVLDPTGKPFRTPLQARRAGAKQEFPDEWAIAQVDGGYVLRARGVDKGVGDVAGVPAGAGAVRGDDGGRGDGARPLREAPQDLAAAPALPAGVAGEVPAVLEAGADGRVADDPALSAPPAPATIDPAAALVSPVSTPQGPQTDLLGQDGSNPPPSGPITRAVAALPATPATIAGATIAPPATIAPTVDERTPTPAYDFDTTFPTPQFEELARVGRLSVFEGIDDIDMPGALAEWHQDVAQTIGHGQNTARADLDLADAGADATGKKLTPKQIKGLRESARQSIDINRGELDDYAGEFGLDAADAFTRYVAPEIDALEQRAAPAVTLDANAHQAAASPTNGKPEPTRGQIEAGNAELGHDNTTFPGLDLSFENPAGSVREDKANVPPKWRTVMEHHYGFVKGSVGADKDHVDVFAKPGTPEGHAGPVFVVDQQHPDGGFDEAKVMLGFNDEAEARTAYLSNYEPGWQGLQSITPMAFDAFKQWVFDKKATRKPAAQWSGNGREAPNGTSRSEQDADVPSLAEREGSLPQPAQPVLPQLRGPGSAALPGVAGQLSGVPEGSRSSTKSTTYVGPQGERRPLSAGQRAVGDKEGTSAQHAQEPTADVPRKDADTDGLVGGTAPADRDDLQPAAAQGAERGESAQPAAGQVHLQASTTKVRPGGKRTLADRRAEAADQANAEIQAVSAQTAQSAGTALDAQRAAQVAPSSAQVAPSGPIQQVPNEPGVGYVLPSFVTAQQTGGKRTLQDRRDEVKAAQTLPAPSGGLFAEWNGQRHAVESIEDAQRKWDAFRLEAVKQGAGASAVGDGVRVVDAQGKHVANISYNGRAWTPEGKPIEAPNTGIHEVTSTKPEVPDAANEGASTVAATPPTEQTPTPEAPANDPAAAIPAPALDKPLADGRVPEGVRELDPVRGAASPRDEPGRADDRNLRGSGQRADASPDAGEQVGDGGRAADVQHGSDGPVAAGVQRLPADTKRGRDFRATPADLERSGSWYDTARRNVDLIDLARKIDAEKRPATPAEQRELAKYVGFGAGEIRNKLFPIPTEYDRQREPQRLVWPSRVYDENWRALAERIDALPREWQETVLQSTQYAHYTSGNIVASIWSGVQRLGFTGGKVFEPGHGIGSFAMLMPDALHKGSKYTGIEFDGPTALISRLLSPQQNMLHDDFTKRRVPKDYFDIAIGNPPFAKTKIVADPEYAKLNLSLHDYFFAKAIDRVRPGGLLVFVTSHYTLDKQTDKARKYLAERADLLGAIRLPQTAFSDNAGTKVVTDVIFLRKRAPGEASAGPAWQGVTKIDTKDGPVGVNEYFAAHPEMVLGQQRLSGHRDDRDRYISGLRSDGEYTVVSYDDSAAELDAKFAKAVEQLPANAYSPLQQDSATVKRETARIDFDPKVKREGVVYLADDGTLMRVKDGTGKALADEVKLSDKDAQWFKGYVGIRELVQQARAAQFVDADWEGALKKLNKAYDAFRKAHGPLLDFRVQVRKSTDDEGNVVETATRVYKNRRLFREDYDAAVVTSLETETEAGDIVKATFLKERTIGKPVTRDVKTIGDALAVSLDETGKLDLDDIGQRLNLTRDDTIEALGNQVYRTPQGQWQLADEYLSGNVVEKLAEAMDAAAADPALERNVEALKAVQPDKLGPSQITVKLGTTWVPAKHVDVFAKVLEAGDVTFDHKTETWQVEGSTSRWKGGTASEYGTALRSPSWILEAVLNSRVIKVEILDSDRKIDRERTEKATTAANEVARKMREKFKSWVWTDTDRAVELVELYNEQFNNIAPRAFDGSHLTLPGVSLRYKLHPHQLRAIWRQIQTGNAYLAHAVGAGKTLEMIAGGMEQKRLGLIRKPMYVVPNHMLEQFANEFMDAYPLANVMVADDENFSKERRKAFVAAATLNAPDAIVITHSAFERIGVKEESVKPIRDAIVGDLHAALHDTGKDERVKRQRLEQQIEQTKQRFDKIVGAGTKDSTTHFEDMGVDFVYVDEAHTFRKLDFTTNQQIKGIDPTGSRRALDLYVKTRLLEARRPGRSMAFASGTAVTNTMGELYTVMRFFAQAELERSGISTFDAWSRQFAESVTALEANAAGVYEPVTRFAKFVNIPELMSRVRMFMDVLNSEHLGALVERPDLEGGKPNLVVVPATLALQRYMRTVLEPRVAASRAFRQRPGHPNPDPMIAIISDGRFASLDPRFFGAEVKADTPTKLTEMGDAVAAEYKATAGNSYQDVDGRDEPVKGSTQMVFYNLGFGQASQTNRGFNARTAFTKRLVEKGIKREHITWFDDADSDAKKEAVFKAMRAGQIRVLIGSAKKMGTGVNVQKRLSMLHYFDAPWYPADIEQPHGRILRQGNQNPVVRINWYTTKGSYDSTMWDMVARKQRFIDQAFAGDKTLRTMEDLSEASLYEQAAALASGDPRAIQLAGLKQDVERLERLQAAHASEQISVKWAVQTEQSHVASHTAEEKKLAAAFKAIGERYVSWDGGKVGSVHYAKHGEFGEALKRAFNRVALERTGDDSKAWTQLGSIEGMPIKMRPYMNNKDKPEGFVVYLDLGPLSEHIFSSDGQLPPDTNTVALAQNLFRPLNAIEGKLAQARAGITRADAELVRLNKKLGAPFEYTQELVEKYADLKRLEDSLKDDGDTAKKAAAGGVRESEAIEKWARETGAITPPFRRDDEDAGAGLPADVLRKHVRAIAAQWANAPRVYVVGGLNDAMVPQAVRDEDKRQREGKAKGDPQAFQFGGAVYLVAPQIANTDQATRALLHEVLGHAGLRGTFGKDFAVLLDAIAKMRKADLEAAAQHYGLDLANEADRRIAAEEVLAKMAETQPTLGWVRKAIAAIRSWLRSAGFKLELTDDEIVRELILPARAFIERGTQRPDATDTPAFSRSGEFLDTMRQAATKRGLSNLIADLFNKQPGTFNWWHRSVGTQFHKARVNAEFRPVYEGAQDFMHDTSAFAQDAAEYAPSLLPQLKQFSDIWRPIALSAADAKALAPAVFTGTLTDTIYGAGELASRFGLNAKQIGQYEQFRAATDRSLDTLVASEVARYLAADSSIPRAFKDMVSDGDVGRFKGLVTLYLQNKLAEADAELARVRLANRRELAALHARHREERAAVRAGGMLSIEQRLEDELDAMKAQHEQDLGQAQAARDKAETVRAAVATKYEKVDKLKREGYAPLMRFGKYAVHVTETNADGEEETIHFSLHESQREANALARTRRERRTPREHVYQNEMPQETYKLFNGLNPETVALFAELSGMEQTDAMQEYLKLAIANRSALKRLIHRKGTPGYSEDASRVLAAFVTSNARQSSLNLHMHGLDAAIADMEKRRVTGGVIDEAIKLRDYIKHPQEEARHVRSLLFVQYLGGSVASALVNMTQPLTMTYPYLAQWGGAVKAAARVMQATKQSLHRQTGALGDALHRAERDGVIQPQEIHQLQAEATRGLGSNQAIRRVLFAWGSLFSLAEQFNRRSTFIAAWNTATAEGIANPFDFAIEAVEQTQGVYNKGNRPNWARGAVGATIFTFKQFSISYVEFLKRLPRKQQMLALGVLMLAAGVQGLPGADDLDDLLDTLWQALGYDTNTKLAKQRFLTEVFGAGGADFILHGFSALPGFPLDVSARMGLGNLIPGTSLLLKSNIRKQDEVLEVLGPAGGMARDVARGISDGTPSKFLPTAFRNMGKSADMIDTGWYRDDQGRKVRPTDETDAFVKFLGFQPAHVARESRMLHQADQQKNLAKVTEDEIADKWARGVAEKDADTVTEARKQLAQWNRDNPGTPIRISPRQIRGRVQDMNRTREQRFLRSTPKELRGTILQ